MPNGIGEYDESKTGVSFTMLKRWMRCREEARLSLMGWQPTRTSEALTFGSIVHSILEEAHRARSEKRLKAIPTKNKIMTWVAIAEAKWREQNPRADTYALEALETCLGMAEAVLPVYFDYWHESFLKSQWVETEDKFAVVFDLPNGRHIAFKGYRDAVFRLKRGLWILETKTTSKINENTLIDALPLDLQSKAYMLSYEMQAGEELRGFVRNIIRRPGLRRGKAESLSSFIKRIEADVDKRPEFYFLRFEIAITREELRSFKVEFVDMLQEFWKWRWDISRHFKNTTNCIGTYGACDMLPICGRGDYSRHARADWAKEEGSGGTVRPRKRRRSKRKDEKAKGDIPGRTILLRRSGPRT